MSQSREKVRVNGQYESNTAPILIRALTTLNELGHSSTPFDMILIKYVSQCFSNTMHIIFIQNKYMLITGASLILQNLLTIWSQHFSKWFYCNKRNIIHLHLIMVYLINHHCLGLLDRRKHSHKFCKILKYKNKIQILS